MARRLGSRSLPALLASCGLASALLAGCTSPADEAAPSEESIAPSPPASAAPASGSPSEAPVGQVVTGKRALGTALTMVPADAGAAVFTDLDAVRERLGYADLTSSSPHADRTAFAEQAPGKAVLLTDGRLSETSSELELDYGFTEDDVDWELSFTGPDGVAGWVLGFRPDQDMSAVERAVADGVGPFDGADVVVEGNVVSSGAATGDAWADDDDIMATVGKPHRARHTGHAPRSRPAGTLAQLPRQARPAERQDARVRRIHRRASPFRSLCSPTRFCATGLTTRRQGEPHPACPSAGRVA
jgi:hypothetical protein